jgi:hypothetical protein
VAVLKGAILGQDSELIPSLLDLDKQKICKSSKMMQLSWSQETVSGASRLSVHVPDGPVTGWWMLLYLS